MSPREPAWSGSAPLLVLSGRLICGGCQDVGCRSGRMGGIRDAMTDEEVYRKHADELVRYATFLVGPSDATDVVADACLTVFASHSWPMVTNQRAYLFGAVLNAARQHRRAAERRVAREARAARSRDSSDPSEVRIEVIDAVRALSLQQRAIVFLTYWHDLPVADIGRQLKVSTRTVQRELARAHRKMERRLR